jgi:hypothetical protein
MKPFVLLFCILLSAGCAAIPRKTTLTNFQTGEVLHGGFNLVTREGWVTMADGTKLTGKIVGVTDAKRSSHSFSGQTRTDGLGITPATGSFSGTGVSSTAATRGEGWCLLRSPDGKLLMEITVLSNGQVTAGYGDAVTNDGRRYKVVW